MKEDCANSDGGIRGGWRKNAARSAVAVLLLLLAVEGYAFLTCRGNNSPLPPLFGNFERIRNVLTARGGSEDFSFIAVGDLHGMGSFEGLAKRIRHLQPDFVVLLGDCVSDGSDDAHLHFRAEIPEYRFTCPVFYVVGNHDVDAERFTLEKFERTYGPSMFSFEFRNCLFIVLRSIGDEAATREAIAFLQQYDRERLARYRHTFVFLHVPPPISPTIRCLEATEGGKLRDALEDLGIEYVFAGHYHGYGRVDRGHTRYIVTGGGGARPDTRPSPQFHHAVQIIVTSGRVEERVVPGEEYVDIEDTLERAAFVHFLPFTRAHTLVVVALNLVAVGLLVSIGAGWLRGWCATHRARDDGCMR